MDDQAAFRAAARAVVSRASGFAVVGEASSGEEALLLSARLQPDLVLMDINMAGLDGIDATKAITGQRPSTVVVLMSTYDRADLPARARSSGAAAYLNKDDLSLATVRDLWQTRGDRTWRTG